MIYKNCKHQPFTQLGMVELSKKLDEFSEQEGIEVVATQVFQRGTTYDSLVYFKDHNEIKEEPVKKPEEPEKKTKESSTIGALWEKKTIISGNFNEEKLSLTHEQFENCMNTGYIDGNRVKIIKNKYKETGDKRPDYVIYPGGE